MKILHTIDQLQPHFGGTCVLTMGALHEGHLSLIRRAVERNNPPVVTTIFLNPTQFAPDEDLSRYPKPIDDDIEKARAAGSDVLFIPSTETIYPNGPQSIPVPPLPDVATKPKLEDAARPTHFAGVCQVVLRFFNLIKPSSALFGEKDYQQLLVIRSMVAQQNLPIKIIGCPVIREKNGLALSSRNVYLSSDERTRALGLSRALQKVADHANFNSISEGESKMRTVLNDHRIKIDYAVIRNADTLMPVNDENQFKGEPAPHRPSSPRRALIAGRLGNTRLIDNAAIRNWAARL